MARDVTQEDVGEIVQVNPPFSGHRQGVLREMGTHPGGQPFHKIDFGEGRQENLIDWQVMILEEGESAEDVFPPPATAPKSVRPKGRKKADEEKEPRPPKDPNAGMRESVLGSGRQTKSFFAPGEDATAKSWLLRVRRGEKKRSELPESLVNFVRTNDKWNRQFADVLELTDEHYEATQRLKAEANSPTSEQNAG